eukprot:14571963-Alexandrium_andersonii.AAC.1
MSASLVGSEMCIRDRPHLALPVGRAGGCDRARAHQLPVGRAGVAAAVSYTHLTLPTICSV